LKKQLQHKTRLMTTNQDSEGNSAVPLPKCKTGENLLDGNRLREFEVPQMEPLQPGPHGVSIRVRVRSSQTSNQYTCVETALAPKTMGPSPHRHEHLDELAFVLEGTLSVMVEDKIYDVPAGGMQWRPRGLVHSFWNATDEPVCFLDMFLNQNFDEYLEAFFALHQAVSRPESRISEREFGEQMEELDSEFGVTQFHGQRIEILERYGLKR